MRHREEIDRRSKYPSNLHKVAGLMTWNMNRQTQSIRCRSHCLTISKNPKKNYKRSGQCTSNIREYQVLPRFSWPSSGDDLLPWHNTSIYLPYVYANYKRTIQQTYNTTYKKQVRRDLLDRQATKMRRDLRWPSTDAIPQNVTLISREEQTQEEDLSCGM